jgi:hypothetical protein
MVRTGPRTEISDVLRVQADGLSANFGKLISSKGDFCGVDGGGEDAELGLVAHLEDRPAARTSRRLLDRPGSLRDDEIGTYVCDYKRQGQMRCVHLSQCEWVRSGCRSRKIAETENQEGRPRLAVNSPPETPPSDDGANP